MKNDYTIVICCFLLIFSSSFAQTYSSGAGGSYTTCAGTFYDHGGVSDYGNSQNYTTTFCPSTSGQCIIAAFTSFDLENNFDYLSVYNGNSTAAPMLQGSSFSASSPGTIRATTTNTTGCLTFKFKSDGGTTSSGWVANISCGSCGVSPSIGLQQDCNGAITICSNQSVAGSSLGSGNYNDLNLGLGNLGCLNNYANTPNGSAEHQSSWYYFSPSSSGTIGMTIAPSTSTTDYDWAIFGPYTTIPCPPTGPPLRCSAASAGNSTGGQTGLANGATDTEEGQGGNGWVSSLNVTAGQKYILFMDNWNATGAPFTLSWQLSGGAALGCTVLPLQLLSFTGKNEKLFNSIHWTTATEINTDYFVLERSVDAINWEQIYKRKGAGYSTSYQHYSFDDYQYRSSQLNYYRLKQVDLTGDYTYSEPISIEQLYNKNVFVINSISPNPSNDEINLVVSSSMSGNHTIEIIDFSCSNILTQNLMLNRGQNTFNLDIRFLNQGLYVVRIVSNTTGAICQEKFVKH